MLNFYDRLKEFKKHQSLSYGDLGEVINKSADAFRQAVKRQSLSELEKEKLEQLFGQPDSVKKETPHLNDVRFEDLVAKKAYAELEPLISKMTEEVVKNIGALDMKMNLITQYLEELQRLQEKTQHSIEILEKKQ